MKTTKPVFLKELTPAQLVTLQNDVLKYFKGRPMRTLHGNHVVRTHKQLETVLGLPYTSGSDVAGIWVTNTEVYHDALTANLRNGHENTFHYVGFGVLDTGVNVAILWDKYENERLINLKNGVFLFTRVEINREAVVLSY